MIGSKPCLIEMSNSTQEISNPQANDMRLISISIFLAFHFIPLAAFIWQPTTFDWYVCIFLYLIRMLGITAGYHRYFAHRSYQTSRALQLIIALVAQSSGQKGVLWWASMHRLHHANSDTPQDPHSPATHGFWYSHLGWIGSDKFIETKKDLIPDLIRYPELVFLDRYFSLPPIFLAILVYLLGLYINPLGPIGGILGPGISTLLIGFGLSTLLLFHATFLINSLMHCFGSQAFATQDNSRNSFIVSLITLGEGWHNNHHRFPNSSRMGLKFYELDITYLFLRLLEWSNLIWKLRLPMEYRK
jgi:stearoyl-CoA desaturase (delta-9 desaturase)